MFWTHIYHPTGSRPHVIHEPLESLEFLFVDSLSAITALAEKATEFPGLMVVIDTKTTVIRVLGHYVWLKSAGITGIAGGLDLFFDEFDPVFSPGPFYRCPAGFPTPFRAGPESFPVLFELSGLPGPDFWAGSISFPGLAVTFDSACAIRSVPDRSFMDSLAFPPGFRGILEVKLIFCLSRWVGLPLLSIPGTTFGQEGVLFLWRKLLRP
jgi:hypothetical protein